MPLQSPPWWRTVRERRRGGSASAAPGSPGTVEEGVLSPGSCMADIGLPAAAGLIVGLDDAGHEIATHDVAGTKPDRLDPLDAAQQLDGLVQARLLAGRQVDLAWVAGDDHLGAFTDAGEKHLHLHGRGVLRLVEDYESVAQRTPAHERQRGDLDHAAHEVTFHLRGRQDVIERIV